MAISTEKLFNKTLEINTQEFDIKDKRVVKTNAEKIIDPVVDAFNNFQKDKKNKFAPTCLAYGRIQSGKTITMVTSTALALDCGFSIIIVLTSNIDLLVQQTRDDFRNGLPKEITVLSKEEFKTEIEQGKRILKNKRNGLVLVCAKGPHRLKDLINFLSEIGANNEPTLIFDDEGDQASIDTNINARSKKDATLSPSTISGLLHNEDVNSIKAAVPNNVFVSVTGTPQGLLLQNFSSVHRPNFTVLLKSGSGYVGGKDFFSTNDPKDNSLIHLIDAEEKTILLDGDNGDIPDGLKYAIRFFLISAFSASKKLGWLSGGFKFLCHPSIRTDDHQLVADYINKYIGDLSNSLDDENDDNFKNLSDTYTDFRSTSSDAPSFKDVVDGLRTTIDTSKVLVINAKGKQSKEKISYSHCYNFLVGGNTLGRGLVIKNLLVTYYVREAAKSQMDTMYQHARMFGYRKNTLPFTKVFLPPQLYAKFQEIYFSDEELRTFINSQQGASSTFPIRISSTIRATRSGILDAENIGYLIPGKQLFPNYPYFEKVKSLKLKNQFLKEMETIFPEFKNTKIGRDTGMEVSANDVLKLFSRTKTGSTNKWQDKNIPAIIKDLKQRIGDSFIVKFRNAKRKSNDNLGLLATGILSGGDVKRDANIGKPVIWFFETIYDDSEGILDWDKNSFIYPTIVLPNNTELVIFNKS